MGSAGAGRATGAWPKECLAAGPCASCCLKGTCLILGDIQRTEGLGLGLVLGGSAGKPDSQCLLV